MNIILIGPPACGKGTQAKLLKDKFNLFHFSTGEALREIASQPTKLGLEIKSHIDKGEFIDDKTIIELVKNKLNEIESQNATFDGVLFDGFPRTVFQANALKNLMDIDFVIEISIQKETMTKRILDRVSCKNCGKSYLLSQMKEKTCSVCGGEIIKRNDDNETVAYARYDDYLTKTFPIIEFYKNHKGYHKVDGEKSANEIFDDICKIIE